MEGLKPLIAGFLYWNCAVEVAKLFPDLVSTITYTGPAAWGGATMVHVAGLEQVTAVASEPPKSNLNLSLKSWPFTVTGIPTIGPLFGLTLVMSRRPRRW
jgi:hypothetical protein